MSRHFGEARRSGQDQEERMVGGDCDGGAVEEPTCLAEATGKDCRGCVFKVCVVFI